MDVVSSSGSPSAKRSSGRCATLSVCPPDDSKRIAVPTRRWMSRSGPLVSASSALAVRLLAGDVGVDRRDEPRLAELAQHHAAEPGLGERRRAKRDERLRARLAESSPAPRSRSTAPASPACRASAGTAAAPATCAGRPTASPDGTGSRPRSGAAGTRAPWPRSRPSPRRSTPAGAAPAARSTSRRRPWRRSSGSSRSPGPGRAAAGRPR